MTTVGESSGSFCSQGVKEGEMPRRVLRRPRAGESVLLPPETVAAIRADLATVADDVVDQIIREVPPYTDAFSGPMGETIRGAVQVALGGFLSLISDRRGPDALAPRASAVDRNSLRT